MKRENDTDTEEHRRMTEYRDTEEHRRMTEDRDTGGTQMDD